MEPSSSSQPAIRAGNRRAVASQPLASAQRALVCILGHCWSVDKLTSNIVSACPVCYEQLADRALCSRLAHRVCEQCRPPLLSESRPRCPHCRAAVPEPGVLAVLDDSLQRMLRDARIDCCECDNWSGSPSTMKKHIARCRKKEHPCTQAEYGCQWTGLVEDREAHLSRCDWRLEACTLPGCEQQMLHSRRAAHEASCEYRPASLGTLQTTFGTVQQLGRLNRFCEQSADTAGEIAETVLREHMAAVIRLFPLVYNAVACAQPAVGDSGEVNHCPWDCGFSSPQTELENHYPHCANQPVACSFCDELHARRLLIEHRRNCGARIVPCPDGCTELMTARDIETGSHMRTCIRALVNCPHCGRGSIRETVAEHQASCGDRPVPCGWCLGSHKSRLFMQQSGICLSQRLIAPPLRDGRPLALHAEASGAVYVLREGQDDPVCIRLPRRMLVAGLGGRYQSSRREYPCSVNLTQALAFEWRGMPCTIAVRCLMDEFRLACQVISSVSSAGPFLRGEAKLCTADGSLVEQLGDADTEGGEKYVRFVAGASSQFSIRAINAIVRAEQEEALFLHLGPLEEDWEAEPGAREAGDDVA